MKQTGQTGIRGFLLFWVGQVVSLLGTSMTLFALTIWAFEATGRATDLALIGAFYTLAMLLVSPFGGVIVDRYHRKYVMMVSDLGAGLVTVALFILLSTGQLAIWHLYVAALVQGAFQSVQWPASSAVIPLMLPKEQYTRANSLMNLAGPSAQIFAPLLAGALLGTIGITGVMMIDIVSFVFAISALALVAVPRAASSASPDGAGGVWGEIVFGFRYIWQRPSLLGLQTIFLLGNFLYTVAAVLVAPLILSRSGNDELLLGAAQTIGAVGGVISGVLISMWGGFKRRIHGVLLGWALATGALVVFGLGRMTPVWAGLPFWGGSLFISTFFSALIDSSNQAIWQSKVPPELQGRVFSIRQLIAMGVTPLASLIAGPLADQVLEPAMQPGGGLAASLGWLVGTGPGAGMALIFIICGGLGVILALIAYLIPVIRDVERSLPDYDAVVA
jgi:DHA3 family macrolide efflux protein-like MFS transporter